MKSEQKNTTAEDENADAIAKTRKTTSKTHKIIRNQQPKNDGLAWIGVEEGEAAGFEF